MIFLIFMAVAFLIPVLNLLYVKKYLQATLLFLVECAWLLLTLAIIYNVAHLLYAGSITVFSINITSEALVYFFPVWLVSTVIALLVGISLVSASD